MSDAAKVPIRSTLKRIGLNPATRRNANFQPTISASFGGTCQPFNPDGHMGLGWLIAEKGYYDYVSSQAGNSNNVAEYSALIGLLETVAALPDPCELRISGDAVQVICEVIGGLRNNKQHLIHHLHARATELIAKLTATGWTINLRWVDRSENIHAHQASTAALMENGIESAQVKPNPGYTPVFREMAGALGISSIKFGEVLYALGLRAADKTPTGKAFNDGYAQRRLGGGGVVYDWHKERTSAAVTACLADKRYIASIAMRQIKPSHGTVVAAHLCGHKALVGRRSTKEALTFVAESLCRDCRAGNKVMFFVQRNQVLPLCAEGYPLVGAIETAIADRRLWPGVYLDCWSEWAHQFSENRLGPLRETCERPELHPKFLATYAALKGRKATELNNLFREARYA